MQAPLRDAAQRYRSISIAGMGKNAGKTTVLNRLIDHAACVEGCVLGLTSIGRDGEAVDVVTGTEKPGIWVRAGTLVATAADMLRYSDITREVLATTGMHTPLGEVVLLRALSDGHVQLAGPSMRDQLARVSAMLADAGATLVLADGAVSRKSLAAPSVSEASILCAGASYSPDMRRTIEDTAHVCALLTLTSAAETRGRVHTMEGAVTDAALEALRPAGGDVVEAEDASRLLVSRAAYARLTARGVRFAVRRPTALCCVCVNPFSAVGADYDAAAFLAEMAAAVPVPVVNVREEAL